MLTFHRWSSVFTRLHQDPTGPPGLYYDADVIMQHGLRKNPRNGISYLPRKHIEQFNLKGQYHNSAGALGYVVKP